MCDTKKPDSMFFGPAEDGKIIVLDECKSILYKKAHSAASSKSTCQSLFFAASCGGVLGRENKKIGGVSVAGQEAAHNLFKE